MQTLRLVPENIIDSIEDDIWKYIWQGKKAKTTRKALQCAKYEGGLRLVNLRIKNYALLIQWVFYVKNDQFLKDQLYSNTFPKLGEYMWVCNLDAEHISKFIRTDTFWYDVLYSWCKYHFYYPKCMAQVRAQSLWLNSNLIQNDRPMLIIKAIQNNCKFVEDIVDDTGSFYPYQVIEERYGSSLNWLQYQAIIQCFPSHWKRILKEVDHNVFIDSYNQLAERKKIVSIVYNKMIGRPLNHIEKCQKWERNLNTEMDIESYHKYIFQVKFTTNATKLRDFHYRLLTRIITTNMHLKWYKIKNSDICERCKNSTETYVHLFYECELSRKVWNKMLNFLKKCDPQISDQCLFNARNIILNCMHEDANNVINSLVLNVKQIIYRNRCLGKNNKIIKIEQIVKDLHDMEHYEASKNNRMVVHYKKWSSIYPNQYAQLATQHNELDEFINNYIENM